MRKTIILVLIIGFSGCISAKLAVPTQIDADRMQQTFPGYSLKELNNGKSLYEQNCNTCHGLKKPSARSKTEWEEIVPRMVIKANKKKPESLNTQDEQLILRYLITMGQPN